MSRAVLDIFENIASREITQSSSQTRNHWFAQNCRHIAGEEVQTIVDEVEGLVLVVIAVLTAPLEVVIAAIVREVVDILECIVVAALWPLNRVAKGREAGDDSLLLHGREVSGQGPQLDRICRSGRVLTRA